MRLFVCDGLFECTHKYLIAERSWYVNSIFNFKKIDDILIPCWFILEEHSRLVSSTIVDFILKRPRLITELHGHTGPVISMAISSSRRLMASGGTDGVRIWDLKTFRDYHPPAAASYG